MSQKIIKNKIIQYLDIISREYIAEIEKQKKLLNDAKDIEQLEKIKKEHLTHIQELKSALQNGYCFGLSLCHAAMDISGKLNWWEHALIKMYAWDDDKNRLDEEFILPGSTQGKPTTLRKIFELAMNFILPSQATKTIQGFMPAGIDQSNILQPDGQVFPPFKDRPGRTQSYFELLDETGKIQTIKQRKTIGGTFTHEQLDSLLSEETIQQTICLIHKIGHTIRIGCHNGLWMVYNANYSHKDISSIHVIGSKTEVINEIFRLMTHSIGIEVASISGEKTIDFSAYDDLIKNSAITLLYAKGLQCIARYAPAALLELFKLADNNPTEGKALRSAIASALVEKTIPDHWTALHQIARYAPASLPELFKLADDTTEGKAVRSAIVMALTTKGMPDNVTGLQFIVNYAPASLYDAIRLVLKNSNTNKFDLAFQALDTFTAATVGWQMIDRQSSEQKEEILTLLVNKIEKLNTIELLELGKKIRCALVEQAPLYRGTNKERHAFFQRSHYGKTTLWQQLMAKVQSTLKERLKDNDYADYQEIMKVQISH